MATFTQKHFIEAANAFGRAYARCDSQGPRAGTVRIGVRLALDEVTTMFAESNDKFDANKFKIAVGVATTLARQEGVR